MKKTLPSGAVLDMTMCPFQVGDRLLKVVMAEAESVKVALGIKAKTLKDLFDVDFNDEMINTLKNLVARMIASDAVSEVLWQCMERVTYNNQKVTKDTFDKEEARADYLIVFKEVLWFNLYPFFKNLGSLFSAMSQINSNNLGSKPK
jgi:hypothetical protein